MNPIRCQDCSVCLQSLINPIKLPCGHTFCFLCVKGVANVSHNCALCRKPFPREFIEKPNVLAVDLHDEEPLQSDPTSIRHVWYYEGRNGWWLYDQRTNDEIDQAFRKGERRIEILIVGQVYAIDFENMHQYRLNDTQRRRRIKYDLISAPKKGVAGLKIDRQRSKTQARSEAEVPVVPTLISSAPSITQSSLVAQISRSNADGQEPNSTNTNPSVPSDSNRNQIRQPADGLGNPNSTFTNWRTTNSRDEHRHSAWSDDDDDDQRIPASERLRPVLIGGEDDSEDLSLINFRIDLNNQ